MTAAHAALDRALRGDDIAAISEASERFRAAVFDVRAVGAWRDRRDLARSAADMLGRVELTAQRVKNLTRETHERLAALESVRTGGIAARYDRHGRVRR